jgi:uncharacterized protein (DUF58 family)
MPETTTLDARSLFDPAFVESVQRLKILARRVARGGNYGEQRSRDLGSGIEFRDFRPYSVGDDLKSVDWNIYRRLGRVFLRLFEEMEDLPVYLCVDASRSAFLEDDPRIVAGLRTAFALTAIALQQHDRVGLAAFGEDLEMVLRPQSGKGRLMRFGESMAALEPRGRTDFESSFRRLEAMSLRPGLVVVISDFYDPQGLAAIEASLKRLRHKVLLVPLRRASDADPTLQGDLELVDCESGVATEVSITPDLLTRYRAAQARFESGLADLVKRRGWGMLRLDCDADVVPQLASLFERGSFVV